MKGPHVFHAFSILRLLSVYISFSFMQFSTKDNDNGLEKSKACVPYYIEVPGGIEAAPLASTLIVTTPI